MDEDADISIIARLRLAYESLQADRAAAREQFEGIKADAEATAIVIPATVDTSAAIAAIEGLKAQAEATEINIPIRYFNADSGSGIMGQNGAGDYFTTAQTFGGVRAGTDSLSYGGSIGGISDQSPGAMWADAELNARMQAAQGELRAEQEAQAEAQMSLAAELRNARASGAADWRLGRQGVAQTNAAAQDWFENGAYPVELGPQLPYGRSSPIDPGRGMGPEPRPTGWTTREEYQQGLANQEGEWGPEDIGEGDYGDFDRRMEGLHEGEPGGGAAGGQAGLGKMFRVMIMARMAIEAAKAVRGAISENAEFDKLDTTAGNPFETGKEAMSQFKEHQGLLMGLPSLFEDAGAAISGSRYRNWDLSVMTDAQRRQYSTSGDVESEMQEADRIDKRVDKEESKAKSAEEHMRAIGLRGYGDESAWGDIQERERHAAEAGLRGSDKERQKIQDEYDDRIRAIASESHKLEAEGIKPADIAEYKASETKSAQDQLDADKKKFAEDQQRDAQSIANEASVLALRGHGNMEGASREELRSKLQEQIDKADPSLQAGMTANMQTKLSQFDADTARKDAYEAAQSQDKISDIGASASEAGLRASGQTRAAGDQEYSRHLEDQVKHLSELADATDDAAKKQQLLNEAQAQSAANPQLVAARKDEEDYREKKSAEELQSRADEQYERSIGGSYKAANSALINKYWRDEVEATRNNASQETKDAIFYDYAANMDMLEHTHSQQIERIQDSTDIMSMRTNGNRHMAALAGIENDYKYKMEEATDDPAMQQALRGQQEARLQSFLHPEVHATKTTMGAIYDDLQKAALEGHGNDAGRAHERATLELKQMQKEDRDAQAHNSGANAAASAAGHMTGDPAHAFDGVADKWSKVGEQFKDALDGAQQLVVMSS